MKKRTLIIAIVVMLVACISVATFAAWDTIFADKMLEVSVGSNVNVKLNVVENNNLSKEVLVPVGAQFKNSNMKETLTYGTFTVTNQAVNNSDPNGNGGNLKVKFELTSVEFFHKSTQNGAFDTKLEGFDMTTFNTYFKVLVVNSLGTTVIDSSNVSLTTAFLELKSTYTINLQFISNASSLDCNNVVVSKLIASKIKLGVRFTVVDSTPIIP